MMADIVKLHFDNGVIDLDFDLWSQRERNNFCASFPSNFSVDVDGNSYAVETCWSPEMHILI